MARTFRIWLELRPVSLDSDSYEFTVWEQIRTAKARDICTLQCGEQVHMSDVETLVQIFEDVVQSAIGRTIGLAERLTF